jgi:hypothetical protein
MAKPELKQFGELDAEDFERHPVWIGCHTADYGKPWYEGTDEETFRPWKGKLPVGPAEGMLLVRAVIELHDGSRYQGFVTPAIEERDDRRPEEHCLLGTQQPELFVGEKRFGFWGGMGGISARAQQELYMALEKTPDTIFPLHFSTDPGLTSGLATGHVDGFYRSTREGVEITIAEPVDEREMAEAAAQTGSLFRMSAKARQGYPQPGGITKPHAYKTVVYSGACRRCGIYDTQTAPFRFAKSGRNEPSGFVQFIWVYDAFFVRPDIAQEILKAGITGVSFGAALDHRTGVELTDRVQMIFPVIACAETSRLPPVTCRTNNEEATAFWAKLTKQQLSPSVEENRCVSSPRVEKEWQQIRALPYCGRVKYHVPYNIPNSLALIPSNLSGAPDLFQTAEWFGSGAQAFRLTLSSPRFMNLIRERRWKGLLFESTKQSGWSERTSI